MRERNYRAAAFSFQDAVNADPTNVEGLFKLGTAYAVLGQYRQAIHRWEQASALTPDEAVKKSAADNIRRAEQRSVEQGGRSPQAAGVALGAGPVSDAARTRARQAAPLYGLAEAFRALGRTAEARQYYERYASSTGSDVRPELQEEARQKSRRLP
jgi:tetratricopeptide (TPR) repeat protein